MAPCDGFREKYSSFRLTSHAATQPKIFPNPVVTDSPIGRSPSVDRNYENVGDCVHRKIGSKRLTSASLRAPGTPRSAYGRQEFWNMTVRDQNKKHFLQLGGLYKIGDVFFYDSGAHSALLYDVSFHCIIQASEFPM